MMNWKGFGRKLSWYKRGIIPDFAWRDRRITKISNTSVLVQN
jgi:hypothetical protein